MSKLPDLPSARIRSRKAPLAAAVLAAAACMALLLGAAPEAQAIPRFAARNGAHCSMCHVNPSGAGARNDYGRDVFEKTRLGLKFLELHNSAMAGRKKGEAAAGAPSGAEGRAAGLGFSGSVTDWLSLGSDLRFGLLHIEKIKDDAGTILNGSRSPGTGFFLMQADLYVSANIGRFTTLYLDTGLAGGNFEAWGLYHHEGLYYVKGGLMTPNYGLRITEHRAFITEDLALGVQIRDIGFEGGLYLGPVSISASVTYPFSAGILNGGLGRAFHPSGGVGLYGTVAIAHAFPALSVYGGISGAMRTRTPAATPLLAGRLGTAPSGVREGIMGAFLGLSLGRFTYLVEADVVVNHRFVDQDSDPNTPPVLDSTLACNDMTMDPRLCGRAWGMAIYHELSFNLLQGIDLIGTWEYRDLDLELRTGAENRFGGGFEIFFTSYSELKFMYRHRRATCAGVNLDGECVIRSIPELHGEDEIIVFVHLFF